MSTATCRREQLIKLLWIFNFTIILISKSAFGIEKSVESACVFSIERHCFHFYPETPLILRWPKSCLFLAEASFGVEVLQFWGKMVAQEIWGLKLVPHDPCCSLALEVSVIFSFSRSSSFPALGFCSFEMKSAQNFIRVLARVFFYMMNLLVWVWSVRAKYVLQRLNLFSKK